MRAFSILNLLLVLDSAPPSVRRPHPQSKTKAAKLYRVSLLVRPAIWMGEI